MLLECDWSFFLRRRKKNSAVLVKRQKERVGVQAGFSLWPLCETSLTVSAFP